MSSILVGVLLTLAGGEGRALDLEIQLSESATVSLRWGEVRHEAPAKRIHQFNGLELPRTRELEYTLSVGAEPSRTFRLAPLGGAGPLRVAFYLPGPTDSAAHALVFARIEGQKPQLLVLGAEAAPFGRKRILPELPVWIPGVGAGSRALDLPELEIQLDDSMSPPALAIRAGVASRFHLPLASRTYQRPVSGPGPGVRYETLHHLDLHVEGDGARLLATALEGSPLDEVFMGPKAQPIARSWPPGVGLALSAFAFIFALLSLVLGRQVL